MRNPTAVSTSPSTPAPALPLAGERGRSAREQSCFGRSSSGQSRRGFLKLTAAGDQAFSFVGTAAFTVDTRFQVRYDSAGGDTTLQVDTNRDGVADYNVILYGVASLVASDFLL